MDGLPEALPMTDSDGNRFDPSLILLFTLQEPRFSVSDAVSSTLPGSLESLFGAPLFSCVPMIVRSRVR